MKVNPKIIEKLRVNNVHVDDSLLYIISLYYKLDVSYIPDDLKRKINSLNIFSIDSKRRITWNIPIFEEQLSNFEWVKSFRDAFKKKNIDRAGSLVTCVERFKEYFANNPHIRVDDVKGATKMYLNQVNPEYVMKSHNFIFMGTKNKRTSELENWVENYRETIKIASGRSDSSNLMQ